jgi:antitoxin component HigA of HigAB toxin-antitoxin module
MPGRFNDLAATMPPRAIRDDVDYDNTVQMIDALLRLRHRTKGQDDYLETLSQLIAAYDEAHYALDTSHITPLSSLKYLLERNDMNASDLGKLLGNRALGSKIMRGEREMSKANIRVLCKRFKVSADLFI